MRATITATTNRVDRHDRGDASRWSSSRRGLLRSECAGARELMRRKARDREGAMREVENWRGSCDRLRGYEGRGNE